MSHPALAAERCCSIHGLFCYRLKAKVEVSHYYYLVHKSVCQIRIYLTVTVHILLNLP